MVELSLQELEVEQDTKGIKALSKYIEKHCLNSKLDVKEFIKPLPKNILMILLSKFTIDEVYHDVLCEQVLKGTVSERPTLLASMPLAFLISKPISK